MKPKSKLIVLGGLSVLIGAVIYYSLFLASRKQEGIPGNFPSSATNEEAHSTSDSRDKTPCEDTRSISAPAAFPEIGKHDDTPQSIRTDIRTFQSRGNPMDVDVDPEKEMLVGLLVSAGMPVHALQLIDRKVDWKISLEKHLVQHIKDVHCSECAHALIRAMELAHQDENMRLFFGLCLSFAVGKTVTEFPDLWGYLVDLGVREEGDLLRPDSFRTILGAIIRSKPNEPNTTMIIDALKARALLGDTVSAICLASGLSDQQRLSAEAQAIMRTLCERGIARKHVLRIMAEEPGLYYDFLPKVLDEGPESERLAILTGLKDGDLTREEYDVLRPSLVRNVQITASSPFVAESSLALVDEFEPDLAVQKLSELAAIAEAQELAVQAASKMRPRESVLRILAQIMNNCADNRVREKVIQLVSERYRDYRGAAELLMQTISSETSSSWLALEYLVENMLHIPNVLSFVVDRVISEKSPQRRYHLLYEMGIWSYRWQESRDVEKLRELWKAFEYCLLNESSGGIQQYLRDEINLIQKTLDYLERQQR